MMTVRMVGDEAWCSRLGCRRAEPLALLQVSKDGAGSFGRLVSNRWRRDGWYADESAGRIIERYRMVSGSHSSKIIRTRRDGSKRTHRDLQMRAPLPAALVCSCGWLQAMEPSPNLDGGGYVR